MLAACGHDDARSGEAAGPLTQARVEHVVDGDTVDLVIDGRTERVRLLGIDAPESVSRNVPRQCFGSEASDALAEALPIGAAVDISRDLEARDRYGRLLLYLHRTDDGLFINRWLVEAGYAEAVSYEPNVAHAPAFAAARHRAVTAAAGLWAACDGPDQPLD